MKENWNGKVPLAHLVRPERLEDFAGQGHLVGKGKLLYRLIKADMLTSAIFYGPPGTGKTTLARLIAAESSFVFRQLSAKSAGVKDIRQVAEEAANPILTPEEKYCCSSMKYTVSIRASRTCCCPMWKWKYCIYWRHHRKSLFRNK